MGPVKLVMLLLGVALLAALGWLFTPERPASVRGAGETAEAEAPPRRGDDPTYAEELRSMSALLQRMRFDLQESEREREREQRELRQELRRETDSALREARDENQRLSEALKTARQEMRQRIEAAREAPREQALADELDALRAELEAMRAGEARDTAQADEAAEGGEDAPEANRVLRPPPSVAEQLRERRARTAQREPEQPPGLETDPEGLARLRELPGMAGIADSLARRSLVGPEPSVEADGARPDYVTIHPYVAGGGRGEARTAQLDPERWRISRFPFALERGPNGVTATIPVYTLPDAATLVVNSTMTPLIGRVPIGGRLTDPFRFKLITGATNLASNGHRIPGITNAVWTGYAVGVREQSCVRAYVDTVTFTFEDGRIHTVNRGKGEESARASVNTTLGFLTDPWGKPCIRGLFIDNAGQYLRGRGLAAFLDGLANAYARSQVTVQRDALGGVSAIVEGNTYEYALGRGVSGATGEIADYIRERADEAFDVVYVPPGINVQLFVETEIPIDYDTKGRMLRYDYAGGRLDALE